MKEKMPDISFERSMNHNYMILSKCSFFGKEDTQGGDYRTKMLLENRIQGLLPVTHRLINGESRYYYEINSLQSLDRLYARTEIRYDVLRRLLSGCVSLFDRLEEYLLDGTQIIIKPEFIYMDVEKMEPYFVCYPDYEGDVRVNFMEFVDELLTRIDHTDEHAVMLGYQIYRYTRNPNYVISEIGNMTEHVIVHMADGGQDTMQRGMELPNTCTSYPAQEYNGTKHEQCIDNVFAGQDSRGSYSFEEEDTEKLDDNYENKNESIRGINIYCDLIGGFFCVLVSLCAGAIALGARMVPAFALGGNNELYLYGAMGMALAAAALFFSCYLKKKRRAREEELSYDGEDCGENQYYTAVANESDTVRDNREAFICQSVGPLWKDQQVGSQSIWYTESDCGNETVFLGNCIVEERMLCGRINGREVNILLDKLPMTVGKMANMSDVVIHDTSVSKMHARFEERDGRVYLCDLNSTNGTVHNGELLNINQSVLLEPGDRLRFGRTSFTYC